MEKAETFIKPNPSLISRYLLKKAGVLLPELQSDYIQPPNQDISI
jgi:hypothetical protein